MAKIDQLVAVLTGDAPPQERRDRLRELDATPAHVSGLVNRARERRSRDPHVAEQIARGALALARLLGDSARQFEARRTLAQINIVLGRAPKALRLLSSGMPDLDPLTDAAVALELAQTLNMLGKRQRALDVLISARARMPDVGAERQLGLLAVGEAHVYNSSGRFQESLSCLDKALSLLAETGTRQQLLSIEINRGVALREVGRDDEAAKLFAALLPELKQRRLHDAVRRVQRYAAMIDLSRGRFHQAMQVFRLLADYFAKSGNQAALADCELSLAECNLALHLPTQALDHAHRARTALEGLGNEDDEALASFYAGVAARALGRVGESRSLIEKAHRVFVRDGGMPGRAAVCRVRLAEADHAAGDLGRAASRLRDAIDVLRALGWHERASRAETFLARVEREAGEPHAALRRLYSLLQGPHVPRTPWVRCDLHHQLGRTEEHVGRLQPALRHVLTATKILEQYRVGIPPDEYMAAFLTSHAQLFEDAVRIVLSTGGRRAPIRAFELSEQARARALLDLLRMDHEGDATDEASALLREVGELEREIDSDLSMGGKNTIESTPADSARRAERLSAREARLRACLDRLARVMPEGARRRRGAPIRHAELAQALPADQVLVEYYLLGEEIHTFISQGDTLRHRRRAVGRASLRNLLGRMSFQLERPYVEGSYDDDAAKKLLESANDVLGELDELLLGDIRELEGVRRFVVIPHGELHAVPFGALLRDGRPLIEDAEVVVAPSAAVYLHCLRTPTSTGDALFLGFADEHAPEIRQEIEALAPGTGRHQAFVGPKATVEVLQRLGPEARIIHLAAHTEYRHDDSMESRLQLADGWLTVPQIYRMEIAPELLVLSGCATGRVSVTRGGDLFGLVRGFLHAGASSILSSLWEVSDGRTAEYMDCFYRAYAGGMPAAAAMRKATLDMRAAHPHPYHWAPFVLTGRGG